MDTIDTELRRTLPFDNALFHLMPRPSRTTLNSPFEISYGPLSNACMVGV